MKDFVPHNYQRHGIHHLATNPRCALWAKPGMGKTPMVLAALDLLLTFGAIEPPILVIATKRIADRTWANEAAKWNDFKHLTVVRIKGDAAKRAECLKQHADIFTANYEQLPWLVEHLGEDWPFKVVIADEATKLKNLRCSVRRTRAGSEYLKSEKGSNSRATALARVAFTKVTHLWELTGSPSANGLLDLWGQAFLLDKGQRLGYTFGMYQQRWFERVMRHSNDQYGEIRALPNAQKAITSRLSDLCYAIDPKDWFDLKEPITRTIDVDLPPDVAVKYKQMERTMFAEINGEEIDVFTAAAKTMKCRQLASGTIYVDENGRYEVVHTEKITAIEEIYNECGGTPLLVAYNFKSDRDMMLKNLKGCVDIATPEGFEAFMKGDARYGIGHPQSVGHGIDGLQNVTNVIVFYSSDFNLEYREQMLERIGPTRQFQSGFERPVYVYDLVTKNTVDELIQQRIVTKCSVQEAVMAAMKRLDIDQTKR